MPTPILTLIIILIVLIVALVIYYIRILGNPKLLQHIEKDIESGQYKIAIKKLQNIIQKNSFDYNAHLMLAKAYRLSKNYKMAIVEYRIAEKNTDNMPSTYEIEIRKCLADLLKKTNEEKEALEEYLLLLKVDPKDDNAYFNAGLIFSKLGNTEKSIQYFKMCLKLNPKNDEASYILGKSLFELNSYNDAVKELTNCLKTNPKQYGAYYYLGLCHKQTQDYSQAITFFESSERKKDFQPQSILNKGICHLQMGNMSKVIDELTRGLKIYSTPGQLLNNMRYFLAEAYELSKQIGKAIDMWELIMRENPKFRDVPDKMIQYKDIRQSDELKDYMSFPINSFRDFCCQTVPKLGLDVHDAHIIEGDKIFVIAREKPKMVVGKTLLKLVKFTRENDPISSETLRECVDDMRKFNCVTCIFISTSGFSAEARTFAETRPFELIDSSALNTLLTTPHKNED